MATYNKRENNVLALCPDCDAITSFSSERHGSTGSVELGSVIVNEPQQYEGRTYKRAIWRFLRCNVCNRGAVAKILDNGDRDTAVLGAFLPHAIERASLPPNVPGDIVAEFREAELDAAQGAHRSASAMLRSVLEKTLKKNGYEEVDTKDAQGNRKKSKRLIDRIDTAAEDQIITETRRKRAHENIRVLGNDVLHDDWREVKQEEFEEAHKYAQRILEDFYDDRPTVEARLTTQKRAFIK